MVTDFREELHISQIGIDEFTYCWGKVDTATDDLIDCDWEQECPFEQMINAVCKHSFDVDRVYNHFILNPYDSITLTEEY